MYYYAGGLDPYGNAYIYDILDWSNPGPTIGYVFLCLVTIIVLHSIVFGFYRYTFVCKPPWQHISPLLASELWICTLQRLRKFIHDDLCGKAETEELFWVNSGQRATPVGTIYTVDREKNGGHANDGYDSDP